MLSSNLGKLALAPVPAKQGQAICLYFDKMPLATHWQVYNAAAQRVAELDFGQQVQQCWQTGGVATGVYWVKVAVDYADGSKGSVMQKVGVGR